MARARMPTGRYTVVYDANVLYPAPLRDLLLRLAATRLFRACWSATIHEEWMHNVLAVRPDLDRTQLERTRCLMDQAVEDCLITGHEALIESLSLPDADDRHVLAAAIHAGADAIITFNLRDFPTDVLTTYRIVARHPDAFVHGLLEEEPEAVIAAVRAQRASLRRPPCTVTQLLETLERQGLKQSVCRLRDLAPQL